MQCHSITSMHRVVTHFNIVPMWKEPIRVNGKGAAHGSKLEQQCKMCKTSSLGNYGQGVQVINMKIFFLQKCPNSTGTDVWNTDLSNFFCVLWWHCSWYLISMVKQILNILNYVDRKGVKGNKLEHRFSNYGTCTNSGTQAPSSGTAEECVCVCLCARCYFSLRFWDH